MADPQGQDQPFHKVLAAELEEIRLARWKRFVQSLRTELDTIKTARRETFLREHRAELDAIRAEREQEVPAKVEARVRTFREASKQGFRPLGTRLEKAQATLETALARPLLSYALPLLRHAVQEYVGYREKQFGLALERQVQKVRERRLARLREFLGEEEFRHSLAVEFRETRISRKKRFRSTLRVAEEGGPLTRANKSELLGLAFSGGGIRSATFNLGVLQGLAELGLLPRIDYLSTVSGGGYIGSWLAAWIKRSGRLPEVTSQLSTDSRSTPQRTEPHEIHFLRQYSNYLTPRKGLLSGDTWAFVGTYLRNLSLNLTILVLALISVLLLARPIVLYFWLLARGPVPIVNCLIAAVSLLALALTYILANLSVLFESALLPGRTTRHYEQPATIQFLVVLPILVSCWLFSAWWWSVRRDPLSNPAAWILISAVGFLALWLLGLLVGRAVLRAKEAMGEIAGGEFWQFRKFGWSFLFAFPSGAVGGALLVGLARGLDALSRRTSAVPQWHVSYLGVPLSVFVLLAVITLHIGLVGPGFSEDVREWLGRLGGILILWNLLLSAFFAVAIDGPWLMSWLAERRGWIKWGLTTLWGAVTGAGVLAGKSPATGSRDAKTSLRLIGKIAPPLFVLGLLLILAAETNQVLPALLDLIPTTVARTVHRSLGIFPSSATRNSDPPEIELSEIELKEPTSAGTPGQYWERIEKTLDGGVLILALCFAGAALLLSWRIGVNEFSMHSFYRNRLVRCYLGASNRNRKKQPFIGFDPEDDTIFLQDLTVNGQNIGNSYTGPYPIFNTALNLVNGEELAWQQRKAASFALTPLYCGYESIYAPTESCGSPLKLGMATATSGAAASPNMGYHTSSPLAFLMTIFDVRLGWWLRNPRDQDNWRHKSQPPVGLFYLLYELLGMTNDRRDFVYLSDGGHFENLGIYELVKRRCRFIVACDAEEDHDMKFGGLGNAIEKCRTDFGVDIEINVNRIRRLESSGLSQWHCAVGRIRYDRADNDAVQGTLLYLKASLTGDEPTDVQRYAAQNREFPHQSTADQWFDESQFESYRTLGQHILTKVIEPACDRAEIPALLPDDLFVLLSQRWYPPSAAVAAAFTRHTATYTSLLQKMRLEPNLKFLDEQVYPEWRRLNPGPPAALWLPSHEDERRAGFYLCNEVIQLMEDAYVDLNLEEEYDHPDNRGWMNLFRHWAWSGMFIASWAISASTYGARFQRFCERRLDLHLGKVAIPNPKLKLTKQEDQRRTALEKAKQTQVLNFWEVELIKSFLASGRKPEELSDLQILPFEMVVESPTRDPNQKLTFTFGFALVSITSGSPEGIQIWYFRVQNHLRKMGLARKALRELMKKYSNRVENKVEKAPVPPRGTSIDEALPTREAVQRFRRLFNSIEHI